MVIKFKKASCKSSYEVKRKYFKSITKVIITYCLKAASEEKHKVQSDKVQSSAKNYIS